MQITYDDYALLKKIEVSDKHWSTETPLGGISEKGATFAKDNQNFHFLIKALTGRKEKDNPLATHLYLDEAIDLAIRKDTHRLLNLDFTSLKDSLGGIILLDDGIHFAYLYLNRAVAKELLGKDLSYIATAMFNCDALLAFEDGYLSDKDVMLNAKDRLDDSNTFGEGGYLAYILLVLEKYTNEVKTKQLPKKLNKTNHPVMQFV
ncbi:MAG: hypothetical protein DI539_21410 [Flavobacterium psychrophilum]|nr:MAG: hypothetical protein DI539_21410 [Flavobacterium psychrophilum]